MSRLSEFAKKRRDFLISLALFLIAFAPRFPALNLFSTVDEGTWLARSFNFLTAVARGNWAATIGPEVYPAVPTYWTGALGILAYFWPHLSWRAGEILVAGRPIAEVYRPSLDLLAFARFPTVLITSLTIALVYLLLARSLNRRVGLLAGLLLAFDPFFVGMSRVFITDTLQSSFALLTIGSLVVALQEDRRRWYAVSGAAAGLAFLSKSPSVVLFGLAPLLCVIVYALRRRLAGEWTTLFVYMGVWYGAAVICIFALWPSMWVQPWQSIAGVFREAQYIGYSGRWRVDAGLSYYPLGLVFHATPFVLIGLLITVITGIRWLARKRARWEQADGTWLLGLWGMVFIYPLVFAFGTIKSHTYTLPASIAMVVLGAIGLDLLFKKMPNLAAKAFFTMVVFTQVFLCADHYPYYFTYYNPVWGGAQAIGGGIGLDQVVNHLNSQADKKDLFVGINIIGIFSNVELNELKGHLLAFPDNRTGNIDRHWTQLDYVAYYRGLGRYSPARDFGRAIDWDSPEFVARIKGVDYVWLYAIPHNRFLSLPDDAQPKRIIYKNGLQLEGYRLDRVTQDAATGKQRVIVTLYWQSKNYCRKDYQVVLKLRNAAYSVWGSKDVFPICEGHEIHWRDDLVMPDEHRIDVLPGTPPGSYVLEMLVLRPQDGKQMPASPEWDNVLGHVEVPLNMSLSPQSLDIEHKLDARLGDKIVLLGYNVSGDAKRGETLYLTLFWRTIDKLEEDYKVFVHVVDKQGQLVNQKDGDPVDGFYPTSLWQAGQIVRDQYAIRFHDDSGAAAAGLRIGMYLPSTGERLPVMLANGDIPIDRAVAIP